MKTKQFSLLGVVSAVAILTGCNSEQAQQQRPEMPPATVTVVTINEKPIKIQSELKGRLSATEEAEVRPQITGIIQSLEVKDGSPVKKGQVLYKVDDAQYKAAYNQALASVNSTKADIESAKSKADRYEKLASENAISIQEADDARSVYQKLVANLAEKEAALEIAKINLEYTKIKAPIDGVLGISSVTPGTLVTANQATVINTVTKMDPIYLDITQPSSDFLNMITLSQDLNTKEIPVELKINEKVFNGVVSSNEFKVDPQTDSIKVRAEFENKNKVLLPGMFGYATVTYAVQDNGIEIPMQSIIRTADGKASVYVVGADNTVAIRPVEILTSHRFNSIVSSGLKEGDKVIFEGIEKTRPGAKVNPVEKQ